MNKALFLVLTTVGLSIGVVAQDRPKFEVFGGYSLESIVPCGTGCRDSAQFPPSDFNGWNASVTGYFYKSAGITADFGGHYASHLVYDPVVGSHRYSFMVGPTYAFRGGVGSAFVHALFGGISQGSGQLSNLDYTKFAWVLGCGLDVNMYRHVAIRPVQLDYERSSVPSFGGAGNASEPVNGFRYSGGVVFKF